MGDPHTIIQGAAGPRPVEAGLLQARHETRRRTDRIEQAVSFEPWHHLRFGRLRAFEGGAALEPQAPQGRSALDALGTVVGSRDVLLVLDNLEQVLDAAGDVGALVRVDGIRVAARASAFRAQREGHDVPAIARALSVGYVLDGSVRAAGTRLRVTAQLTDAGTGYQIWSERFDRELEDVFTVQDEIAAGVVVTLTAMSLRPFRQSSRLPSRLHSGWMPRSLDTDHSRPAPSPMGRSADAPARQGRSCVA